MTGLIVAEFISGGNDVDAVDRVLAFPPAHEIYDAVRRYADSMGADGRYFVSLMQNASPAGMHYPDAWDLCGVGITTWVQRGC